jgi:hypothetical protein
MKSLREEVIYIKTLGIVWYVKWLATLFIISAVLCRSVENIPKIYDQSLSLVGTILWLWVGLQWKDRALTVLNSILVFVLAVGVLKWISVNLV